MYVSIDMDVGAGNALHGVRFTNSRGLNEKQIYRISELLNERISSGVNLIGMDLTEFNDRFGSDWKEKDRFLKEFFAEFEKDSRDETP